MTSHSKHYRINEVAQKLCLTQRTIYSLLQSGKLKSRKFGGARRIGADQLDEYLKDSECLDQLATPNSSNEEGRSTLHTTMASASEKLVPERRFMKLPSMR